MEQARAFAEAPSDHPEESTDRLFAAAIVRPEQFQYIWGGQRELAPEQRLAMAILEQSIHDLKTFRYARRRRHQRRFMEAYDWVLSNDLDWVFSYVNVCALLDLPCESLRNALLADQSALMQVAA